MIFVFFLVYIISKEAKVRQLSSQLQQTRNDYDQYKKRASQLLQKYSNAQTESSRLSELEDTIRQLRFERRLNLTFFFFFLHAYVSFMHMWREPY